MQFTLSILSLFLVAASSSVEARAQSSRSHQDIQPRTFNEARTFGSFGLSGKTCYNAPVKPWNKGCNPGWYIGKPCGSGIPKWDGGDFNFCSFPFSSFLPICQGHNGGGHGGHGGNGGSGGNNPVCDDKYQQTFSNYTTVAKTGVYQGKTVGAATIDNANYLTYGLVDTVDDCLNVCDQISTCTFVNVYQEFNSTIKDGYGAGKLTCAAYKACSGTDQATNYGGQDDPTYIVNSQGWCKNGVCQ